MAADRGVIRAQLQTFLLSSVTAAQRIDKNETGDLGSASPVIVISSRGSSRSRLTFQGSRLNAKLWLDIYTLAAETTDGEYTYADSADVIDTCEAQIATVFDSHQRNLPAGWEGLDYEGDSAIDFGFFGADGIPRFRERIGIVVTIFG
jgi:hypothetical protein